MTHLGYGNGFGIEVNDVRRLEIAGATVKGKAPRTVTQPDRWTDGRLTEDFAE